MYSAISSLARNKSIEMGVAPFSMTPSVPPAIFLLAKSVLPVPTTSGSTGLEDLVSLGRMLLAGDTINLLDWKFRLSPTHFVTLTLLNQQLKKGVTVLTGMVEMNCQGRIATTKWKYGR